MNYDRFTQDALLTSIEFKRLLIDRFKTCRCCCNIHSVRRPRGWPEEYGLPESVAVLFSCCTCGATQPIMWSEVEKLFEPGQIHEVGHDEQRGCGAAAD